MSAQPALHPALSWGLAFALTQAIEVPIYVKGAKATPLVAFGASAITHPVVWFLIPPMWLALHAWLGSLAAWLDLRGVWELAGYGVFAESFAVGTEALYFHLLRVKRPLVWSLVANAASALTGLALSLTLGWP